MLKADVDLAVKNAAKEMRWLDPGPMAELRRVQPDAPAPAFWRIAVKHPCMTQSDAKRDDWVVILHCLALLTQKGEAPPGGRPALHAWDRPLGAVLCDGGQPDWPPKGEVPVDGVFRQRRLVQLLATRGTARRDAVLRAVRMVATRRNPTSGVDVTQIAAAILWPDRTAPIAEAYFRRLDRIPSRETAE